MTLTNRLSLAFLTLLAVILLAFVASVWLLIGWQWSNELQARLSFVAASLIASMEIEPDGVEWNPSEHALDALQQASDIVVQWNVRVPEGQLLDSSEPPLPEELEHAIAALSPRPGLQRVSAGAETWDVIVRDVTYDSAVSPQIPEANPGSVEPDDTPEYPVIRLSAAVSTHAIEHRLQQLGVGLISLALLIWIGCALGARAFFRQALTPLRTMAQAAEQIGGAEIQQRLPVPAARDELGNLAESFNGVLDRLEASLTQERRFASAASHQLRTPLTIILGEVELALRRDREATEYLAVLQKTRTQTLQLTGIVESLLWLARADARLQTEGLIEVDLLNWLPTWLAQASLSCPLELPSASMRTALHPVLFGEALSNLVDNALQYGTPGVPPTLRLRREAGGIVLDVQNAGSVISDDELVQIFEPFYRGESSRPETPRGLGLGLAIVRQIVLWHHGEISVTSSPTAGTVFSIRLPALA